MGMVGGGEGSFIGPVHRIAAELDGEIELVCGAFSSDAEVSRRSGVSLYGLSEARSYASYRDMFSAEAALPAELDEIEESILLGSENIELALERKRLKKQGHSVAGLALPERTTGERRRAARDTVRELLAE